MIRADDLIAQVRIPLSEGWGYIWGATGQTWTQAKQDAATRPMTVQHGQRWVGKRVIDCSGMFYWAYKQLDHKIYHGSDTIWKSYCSARGQLAHGARSDGQPIKPGTAVFLYRASDGKRHHIGLYVGDGQVIEAKGTINGVVSSRLDHWDEWGELKDVDYEGIKGDEPAMTQILKKGARGDDVRELQELLIRCGYGYIVGSADGVYGEKTVAAVKAFQRNNGLDDDGIAGAKTQQLLRTKCGPAADELPEDDDEFDLPTVGVPLTYAQAQRILAALKECQRIITEAMDA